MKDPALAAAAVELVYVSNQDAGISRVKSGKSFSYFIGDSKLTDKEHLKRIKSLVIPPAWEQVWICLLPNGHLQATGLDVKQRRQYRYHPAWNTFRNETKFFHILDFGKSLPDLRKKLKKDLDLIGLPQDKVLAVVVSLMEMTHIRIGNNFYEKLYGSFGLTTLKDRHVNIKGHTLAFQFKGKKGVQHTISIKNKKLANIVQKCKDIPGKELFQYYDEEGARKSIDSGMVNEYIKKISGGNYTAKDFRTWAGTVRAIEALREQGAFETDSEAKSKVVSALKVVSTHLGNTPNVCKKYYVHPRIFEMYQQRKLDQYLFNSDKISEIENSEHWSVEEELILRILS
jgi:DNA topoisomerase-1